MTFETSRKKQVLVLQPRGKALYDDDSSFGSKMLAKMGWSKGKGLGKEQHGTLDFIQIRYKNNANGLGFDGLKDNQWTENESSFDQLLKNLNGESAPNSGSSEEQEPSKKPPKKSLEEQSKSSRARVHYKKFTRGKDVCKYSEKDLANILGKKSLVEVEPTPVEEAEAEDEKPNVYDSNLIINKGLSVTDYFKDKMSKLKGNKTPNTTSIVKFEEQDDECQEVAEVEPEKKKKKKRKASVEAEPEVEEPPKKKKKSKKNREEAVQEPEPEVVEKSQKSKKKKSKNDETQTTPETVTSIPAPAESKSSGEPQRPTGANAVYSNNVIQIPSHVAQKLSSMTVENFRNANIANVVGYGLTEDIEIKIVQTKIGDNFLNTDKYSLYNTDRMMTKQRVNPRKILSKIKRTKKSIQVI